MKDIRKMVSGFSIIALLMTLNPVSVVAATSTATSTKSTMRTYQAYPPIHVFKSKVALPQGMSPQIVKDWYHIPKSGGTGTIAIIGAYNDPTIEADLNVFNQTFALPGCTKKDKCFEQVTLHASTPENTSWALEKSLDVEWAHAIAPGAHILLVEAKSPKTADLLEALDYARARKDVTVISMSWGGPEFPEETSLDSHFTSDHGIVFVASSGDNGAGVSWPAVSKNVLSVGGTSLIPVRSTFSEIAWSGSGGGVSTYEAQPNYQQAYSIPRAHGMRAVPDVSYNADPRTGYSVYHSNHGAKNDWYVVGGTSAGAPQWAAIYALGGSATLNNVYNDKAAQNNQQYLRDIVSGSNGTCSYYCDARKRYDYVTGLGSPLTVHF